MMNKGIFPNKYRPVKEKITEIGEHKNVIGFYLDGSGPNDIFAAYFTDKTLYFSENIESRNNISLEEARKIVYEEYEKRYIS